MDLDSIFAAIVYVIELFFQFSSLLNAVITLIKVNIIIKEQDQCFKVEYKYASFVSDDALLRSVKDVRISFPYLIRNAGAFLNLIV